MAAVKKLTGYVYVSDDKGVRHHFGPDDTLPAWARKAITNPKAYGEGDEPETHVLGDDERAETDPQ